MNRHPFRFLLLIAPALALALSCLGMETGPRNVLGWFLALVGVSYVAGIVIVYWRHNGTLPVAREEHGSRSFWLVLPGFLAVFFGPPLETIYLPETLPRNQGMQVAGAALLGVATALFTWTRLALRELYTGNLQVIADHRLVLTGPYHYLRHPGYAGFILLALGLAVGYASLIGLAAIPLLLLPALVYRMRVEERLLTEHFGDAYRDYSRKTHRLIPGVW